MKSLKLVKYGHEQCQPCRLIKPILTEISDEFSQSLDFVDKDTMQMTDMTELQNAKIKAVPTMILFKDDVEVWRHVGLISKDALQQAISSYV